VSRKTQLSSGVSKNTNWESQTQRDKNRFISQGSQKTETRKGRKNGGKIAETGKLKKKDKPEKMEEKLQKLGK
jgi:hypothetical protein